MLYSLHLTLSRSASLYIALLVSALLHRSGSFCSGLLYLFAEPGPSTTATNTPPHALHTTNNVLLVQLTPAATQCSGELIHSRPLGAVPLAARPGGVRPPPTATRKPPAANLLSALCKPPNTYFRPLHPLTHNPLTNFDTKLPFNTAVANFCHALVKDFKLTVDFYIFFYILLNFIHKQTRERISDSKTFRKHRWDSQYKGRAIKNTETNYNAGHDFHTDMNGK